MADTYEIKHGNETVGTAKKEKQGLYCHFSCRCRLPDEGMYRIHVICGEHREDLGICVPMDGSFGMDKKLPAKRLGEGTPAFELVPKDWKPQESNEPIQEEEPVEEMFIPVSEEEPFEHLDELENAVFAERDDQPGILIPDPADQ